MKCLFSSFAFAYYSDTPCTYLVRPVTLAQALALDHDPIAHGPRHLVVGDPHIPAQIFSIDYRRTDDIDINVDLLPWAKMALVLQ